MATGRWPAPGQCSAGAREGAWVLCGSQSQPTLPGQGDEGYLGVPGGICSSVGEVSMMRTSSRSM